MNADERPGGVLTRDLQNSAQRAYPQFPPGQQDEHSVGHLPPNPLPGVAPKATWNESVHSDAILTTVLSPQVAPTQSRRQHYNNNS